MTIWYHLPAVQVLGSPTQSVPFALRVRRKPCMRIHEPDAASLTDLVGANRISISQKATKLPLRHGVMRVTVKRGNEVGVALPGEGGVVRVRRLSEKFTIRSFRVIRGLGS